MVMKGIKDGKKEKKRTMKARLQRQK